jgi:hypothetical protein
MVRMVWWSGEREGKRTKEKGQEDDTKGFALAITTSSLLPRRRATGPSLPPSRGRQIEEKWRWRWRASVPEDLRRHIPASFVPGDGRQHGNPLCSALGVKAQPPHPLLLQYSSVCTEDRCSEGQHCHTHTAHG